MADSILPKTVKDLLVNIYFGIDKVLNNATRIKALADELAINGLIEVVETNTYSIRYQLTAKGVQETQFILIDDYGIYLETNLPIDLFLE